ncbi:Cat operon transcriptional regulator [Ruegeria denitrificans]|uniref:Cat operon transcriptional regulator n=1 Tax=Ruegeria denitrificans TaxID=1715692 RepID=A0A0P1I1M1_9RHOB|nr:LysR family transcriptional regulator [Ruegeria denitrificans]CUJ84817.1 Cat operon transcriptional regulator [Ruegeria denitrificans]
MDIEFARAFVAIVETGSFRKAAARLNLEEATVRDQIAAMERLLGKQIFKENGSAPNLTSAGRHFLPHARALIRTWTKAKLEVALPEDIEVALEIGTTSYLWEHLLLPSFFRIRKELPKIAIKTIVGTPEMLAQQFKFGSLDAVITHDASLFDVGERAHLFRDEYVLVGHDKKQSSPDNSYVFLDWGPQFRAEHLLYFPHLVTPNLQLDASPAVVDYVEDVGASGYFPHRLICEDLSDLEFDVVTDAPRIPYSAYAIFDREMSQNVMAVLKAILTETSNPAVTAIQRKMTLVH